MLLMTWKVVSRNVKRMYLYFFGTWAVHCEVIYDDGVWAKIKSLCKTRKLIWYCITPVNYDLMSASGNLRMGREAYSRLLKRRYKEIEAMGQEIQLHVHLSILKNMGRGQQMKMIRDSREWMLQNGFKVTKFVPGWWNYDNDTLEILEELGLKMVGKDRYYEIHDYELGALNKHLGV
ncbi:hypothetical protein COV19_05790 [Candidatus Woesearchaeota archaeon CG10_big_fil_rev_8_21_14_0_10_44_13]|nr:MAG: hypothetical protein COV19_05790 [Candidatus Woesearchaeota archaeon CG10_big_fil_rev_8_21_14_0_10_44_13]